MADVADYYEVLGVSRDASQDEIKRAFRRLARETHPDANHDDPNAEHRFREVAQAYEVLSDPQKRAAYDRGGQVDIGDLFSSFAGIDDLLSRFFGGGFGFSFGGTRAGPAQGSDVLARVTLTLEEAASDVTREVTFRAPAVCSRCNGNGSEPGVPLETCDRCAGQGSVRITRQTFLGTTMSITACDKCGGRGRVVTTPCTDCDGAGSIVDDRTVNVEIPAGIEDGSRLRVTGRGAAGEAGGRPGDLYVEVSVDSDPRFVRHGADLLHTVVLGFSEAALGTAVKLPTVGGEEIDFDIPAGTQPGTVFKLSRLGMPRLRRRGRGDLLVEVRVAIPTELDEEREDLLRAYAELAGERPRAPLRRRRRRSEG